MVGPIDAIGAIAPPPLEPAAAPQPAGAPGSFAALLAQGAEAVDERIQDADAAARAFALDDGVPLHQVTFALEQARLSFELMLQVRARLVEGYQEIMRMQL